MSENGILTPTQSGFTALDNKKSCAGLFVDLSKAFDCVDHALLLQHLQHISFSDATLMSGRIQCVSVDNNSSALVEVKMGVPQGSILGPLLLIIYTNNMRWPRPSNGTPLC